MTKILINIFFLLGLSYHLTSQSIADSIILNEIELIDVKEHKHSIGNRIDVINKNLIKNSSSESFAEILQRNTTIYVKSYGALNTPTFRGTSSSHTLISWNGIPINSVASGMADLRLLPSNGFNNLGISYGGNSTIFGSGSLGGTIHLNNIPIFKSNNNSNFCIEKGSFGLNTINSSFIKSNEKLYFHLNYSSISDSNNFKYQFNDDIRINNHSFTKGEVLISNFAYKFHDKFIIKFNYWKSNLFREIPGNITVPNSTAEQVDNSERLLLSINKVYNRCKINVNHALLYDNLYYDDDPKQINSFYQAKSNISEINIKYPFQYINLNLNLSLMNNNLKSSSYENIEKTELIYSTYSSISYKSKSLLTDFSIRKQYNEYVESPLLPSFSSEFFFKMFKLRGRINKNFRIPTYNDRFWISTGSVGNTNLLPESGLNREIGLDYYSTKTKSSITFFSLNVNNWILWRQQSNGIWMPENLRKVNSNGVEFNFTLNNFIKKFIIFNEFNYQYNLSTNLIGINNLDVSVGKQLIYTPKNKANITTGISFNKWKIIYNQSFVGKVYTSSDNINSLPCHYITNLSIKQKISKTNTELSFSVDNLFNIDFQTYLNYPNPRRKFLIQINIQLNTNK